MMNQSFIRLVFGIFLCVFLALCFSIIIIIFELYNLIIFKNKTVMHAIEQLRQR